MAITTADLAFSGSGRLNADAMGHPGGEGPGTPLLDIHSDDKEYSGAGAAHGGQGSRSPCINAANSVGWQYCQSGYFNR